MEKESNEKKGVENSRGNDSTIIPTTSNVPPTCALRFSLDHSVALSAFVGWIVFYSEKRNQVKIWDNWMWTSMLSTLSQVVTKYVLHESVEILGKYSTSCYLCQFRVVNFQEV